MGLPMNKNELCFVYFHLFFVLDLQLWIKGSCFYVGVARAVREPHGRHPGPKWAISKSYFNLSSARKRDGKTTLKILLDMNLLSAVRFGFEYAVLIFEFSYKAIKQAFGNVCCSCLMVMSHLDVSLDAPLGESEVGRQGCWNHTVCLDSLSNFMHFLCYALFQNFWMVYMLLAIGSIRGKKILLAYQLLISWMKTTVLRGFPYFTRFIGIKNVAAW